MATCSQQLGSWLVRTPFCSPREALLEGQTSVVSKGVTNLALAATSFLSAVCARVSSVRILEFFSANKLSCCCSSTFSFSWDAARLVLRLEGETEETKVPNAEEEAEEEEEEEEGCSLLDLFILHAAVAQGSSQLSPHPLLPLLTQLKFLPAQPASPSVLPQPPLPPPSLSISPYSALTAGHTGYPPSVSSQLSGLAPVATASSASSW